jgi:hypothetical protein
MATAHPSLDDLWPAIAVQTASLFIEANFVVFARFINLADSEYETGSEINLMIAEKIDALCEVSKEIERYARDGNWHLVPTAMVCLLRKRVQANAARLMKESSRQTS